MLPRMLSFALIACLSLSAALVSAPTALATSGSLARRDIADLRHQRFDQRLEPLGWSSTGDFYYRERVCEDSAADEAPCHVAIVKVGRHGTERTDLFREQLNWYSGGQPLSFDSARSFIVREQEVLATLPELTMTSPIDAPTALGPGTRLVVQLRDGERPTEWSEGPIDVNWSFLAVVTDHGSRWLAPVLEAEPIEVSLRASLTHAYRSPDGRSVVVIATYGTSGACMSYGDGFVAHMLDIGSVRRDLGLATR